MTKQRTNTVTYQDFDKICRFCFQKGNNLKPIFSVRNGRMPADEVIRECLNLLVYVGDGLPEQMCNVCYKKVFDYYDFLNLCHSAANILSNIHQKETIGVDVNEEKDVDDLYATKLIKTETEINTVLSDNEPNPLNTTKLKIIKLNTPLKVCKSRQRKSDIQTQTRKKKFEEKTFDHKVCPICGVKLRCLTQHMKTHFQEKNLKICDICGFSTVQKSNLQRHILVTHVKEGEYVCKICLVPFTDLRELNRHKKFKHQERKHPCPNCKAIFHTKFGLKKHQTIHSGEKKHFCDECGKSYRMLDSLKAHQKRHLDPTIPCTYCTKMFYTKNELKSHVGLHTGTKAFKCDICSAAFVASSSLAVHRRQHIKDKILPKCGLCGMQFNDRVLLKMHLNDHKKDSP